MTIAMQPIYTQTVGAGGVAGISFNNIPQTFTDLKVVCSVRASRTAQTWDATGFQFNDDATGNYSGTLLYAGASGSGAASINVANQGAISLNLYSSTVSATANTFGNGELYIPNYRSSNFKSVIGDSVAETNGTADWIIGLGAGLWRSTSAINKINVYPVSGGTFLQYSTITLYGITKG